MKNIFLFIFLQIIIILTINSQLTVLNPYDLAEKFTNKQIDIEYGKIGLLNDFYVRGQLYMDNITEQKDACAPLNGMNLRKKENSLYEENFKIILAYQGSCSFSQKARNAQNVGASMIIIINTENTPLNDIIFNEDSYDIKIPVAFINNNDGKIIDNFINSNPSLKVIVEVNFSPRSAKNFVDFKLFFSSSEPRAYLLLESMEKYIDNYGDQVHFIPYYTVHQNPYYVEESPKSNINCLSRGKYCYFPKETTIIQEGQKILLEDIRQKCMYKLSKEKSIKFYYEYMKTFYKNCINNPQKALSISCSKDTLIELGYPENYLDECMAESFGVKERDLLSPSYIDKENKIMEEEYNEILKYKITSFPSIVINDKVITDLIKESIIVKNLCDNVKIKPTFCTFAQATNVAFGETTQSKKIFYVLMFMLVFVNISIFFMCRAYILEKINDRVNSGSIDIDGRINNVVNNYFALKNNSNDYKAFDSKNQVIEMQEGKVNTV